MGNFLTRLSERTLGMAPVVQPMITPMFAPEPANHLTGLEWDSEAPGDPYPSARKTQPARDAPTGQREDQGNVAPTTSKHHQETPDTRSEPHRPGEARSSERAVAFRQEDQRDLAPVESPRRTPEPQPESSHLSKSDQPERRTISEKEERRDPSQTTTRYFRTPTKPLRGVGPDPTLPGALSTSQDALPESSPFSPSSAEGESGQAVFRPVRTLVGQGETLTSRPLPGPQASLDGAAVGSRATLNPPEPPDVPHPVTPRVVRPRLEDYPERGSQEPRVAAPELPTIRVAIGRIEVRAVTPPPARWITPVRPGPLLSLDDYLKQRNRGQR